MLQMSVESHAEPRGRAGAGAGRGSGPWESLTTVVLSLQGRVSCTGRLMVQAVNQRGRSPRPSAGHPHSRRYVPKPSTVSGVGSPQRGRARRQWACEGKRAPCGWGGDTSQEACPGPATVPHRGPPGGPLVSCDHLVPEGLCSRHSAHKFTRDPDLKARLATFWTLSVPAAPGACEHGQARGAQ